MTKIIRFPSGSFGNFFSYLLNFMSTGERLLVDKSVYDLSNFKKNIFVAHHFPEKCDIYINVDQQSYLKYLVTNINRISGSDLVLEQLHEDTFEKIKNHTSLNFFKKSLSDISQQVTGNVSNKFLREWIRLCFFANNYRTINQYIGERPTDCYIVNFEIFFCKDSIKKSAYDVLNYFDIDIVEHNVNDVINEFHSKQYYKHHVNINNLTQLIKSRTDGVLTLNLVEQAWLDNWLETTYQIVPKLEDSYPTTVHELINLYNLPVDNN